MLMPCRRQRFTQLLTRRARFYDVKGIKRARNDYSEPDLLLCFIIAEKIMDHAKRATPHKGRTQSWVLSATDKPNNVF